MKPKKKEITVIIKYIILLNKTKQKKKEVTIPFYTFSNS
jgi:hypothetical protein